MGCGIPSAAGGSTYAEPQKHRKTRNPRCCVLELAAMAAFEGVEGNTSQFLRTPGRIHVKFAEAVWLGLLMV